MDISAESPEHVARQMVTAALIARDEAPSDYARSKADAVAWLAAVEPLSKLVTAAVERIEESDVDFGSDLLSTLAGLVATTLEWHAEVVNLLQHDGEPRTGLSYWKEIAQRME
jgi:hypothetical protein